MKILFVLKVFSTVTDTGIPVLIEHVHTITKVRRRHGIERLIRGVTHFILNVAGYLVEVGTQVSFTSAFKHVSKRELILQLFFLTIFIYFNQFSIVASDKIM